MELIAARVWCKPGREPTVSEGLQVWKGQAGQRRAIRGGGTLSCTTIGSVTVCLDDLHDQPPLTDILPCIAYCWCTEPAPTPSHTSCPGAVHRGCGRRRYRSSQGAARAVGGQGETGTEPAAARCRAWGACATAATTATGPGHTFGRGRPAAGWAWHATGPCLAGRYVSSRLGRSCRGCCTGCCRLCGACNS